ncbi:hypothetical protein [Pararhodobacter sp. SW119]|uniref:hypothetical protein n=1 Tax=Pararhodobacter sp. SW119 TaxID=2780075 RepID=UPI001ADF638B|nr:hypothetical protein [Pararhodobacter sp. SW119]
MFDNTQAVCDTAGDAPPTAAASPIHKFAAENADGLVGAAALLGGRRGKQLAHTLIERLAVDRQISASTHRALEALRALLALENVHDENREEAGNFAMIDPADPVVETICLLTDSYTEALVRSGLRITA